MTATRFVAHVLIALALGSGTVRAALFDRGNGLIYDDVLNVTWLQDADFGFTSGQTSAPVFQYWDAVAWVDQLVYQGFSDWRLPALRPVNGVAVTCCQAAYDGSRDYGWNVSYPGRTDPFDAPAVSAFSTAHELAYMFHVNLGLLAQFRTDGSERPGVTGVDYGLTNTTFVDGGTGKTVSFLNLRNYGYWYDRSPPPNNAAWCFLVFNGFDDFCSGGNYFQAWAVRDGDVVSEPPPPPAVPEPATGMLLATALLTLGFSRKAEARRCWHSTGASGRLRRGQPDRAEGRPEPALLTLPSLDSRHA